MLWENHGDASFAINRVRREAVHEVERVICLPDLNCRGRCTNLFVDCAIRWMMAK
jgi:hypothetical protein